MPTKTIIQGTVLPLCVVVALTITTATSVSACGGIENESFDQGNSVTNRTTLQSIVEMSELRGSIIPRQKWKLGLFLSDEAAHADDISNYFKLMSTAQEIALELANIGMRDWLLSEIAARQISVGDLWSARANVLAIEHMGWKTDTLILIAHAAPKGASGSKEEGERLNDWAAAKDAAMQIQDEEWREEALLDLGIAPLSAANLR